MADAKPLVVADVAAARLAAVSTADGPPVPPVLTVVVEDAVPAQTTTKAVRASRLSHALVGLQSTLHRLREEEAAAGEAAGGPVPYGEALGHLEDNVRSLLHLRDSVLARPAAAAAAAERAELTTRVTLLISEATANLNDIRRQRDEHIELARRVKSLSPDERRAYLDELRQRKPAAAQPAEHPSFNLLSPHELPHPDRTGWLVKLGGEGLLRNWRRRFFAISSGRLYYYRTPDDHRALNEIDLDQVTVAPTAEYDMPFLFRLVSPKFERVFFFSAASHDEMEGWMDAIRAQAGTPAPAAAPVPAAATAPALADGPLESVLSALTTFGRSISRMVAPPAAAASAEPVATSRFYMAPAGGAPQPIAVASASWPQLDDAAHLDDDGAQQGSAVDELIAPGDAKAVDTLAHLISTLDTLYD